MATKEELIQKAKDKHKREQLIAAAKAKWATENKVDSDGGAGEIETGSRSFLESMTLGLSEPVLSAANAAGNVAQDYLMNVPTGKDFSKYYDEDVARRRLLKSENPMSDVGGQVTGALLPALATGGTSAVAKGAGAATKGVTAISDAIGKVIRAIPGAEAALASKGVLGSGARILESGAKAAVAGTAAEGLRQEVETASGHMLEEEKRSLGDIATDSALFGAALTGVGEGIKQGGRLAKGAARVFTGVGGDDIDAYLANPERIRNAKTIEEIKESVDETIAKLADDVENAKITQDQAKDALKQAQSQVDDLVRENKFIVASKKADLRSDLREAKNKLDDVFRTKTSEIKAARIPIRADDVLDSVEQVKQQVTDLSQESYKILELHKGRFSINGVSPQISKIQNSLKVGDELLSGDANTAYQILGSWKDKIKNISKGSGKGLTGSEVKRIIQELDSDIRKFGDRQAGEFSDKTYNALMNVRKMLDTKIKTQVPGYAQVMEETAKLNVLRGQLTKAFGRREAVVSKLSRIDSPNLEAERAMLKELGELSGKDFTSPLDELVNLKAQGRTAENLIDVKRSLPEYQDFTEALAAEARAKRPGFGDELLNRARTASPEAAELRKSQAAYEVASNTLDAAKAAQSPYKRVSPANSENFIRSLMSDRARKIELKKIASGLSELSDENFVQMIDDLRVREGFEKGFRNGSSNVNLWGTMAAAFGLVSGDPTFGMASGGAGVAFGKIMDAYGPKMTKKVLDGIVYMKGIPTVQKINQVFGDVPPQLREQLKNDLIRAVNMGNSTPIVTVPQEERANVAKDIFNSENVNSIEKANAISSLNQNGSVSSDVMQKVMVGDELPEPQKPETINRGRRSLEEITDFIGNKKPEAY